MGSNQARETNSETKKQNLEHKKSKEDLIIYTLKLKGNKYYVGSTKDLDRRLREHKEGTGSEWTKLHSVVSLIDSFKATSPFDEDLTTKKMMSKYGIDNVRGGTYCQITLHPETKKFLMTEMCHADGKCFKCGKEGHFAKDCTDRICIRCGYNSHTIDSCNSYKHKDGRFLCPAKTKKGTKCRIKVSKERELCSQHR